MLVIIKDEAIEKYGLLYEGNRDEGQE